MQAEDEDEVVHVPVPKKYLGVVYRALAEVIPAAVAGGAVATASGKDGTDASEDDEPGTNGYTEAKIRRLKKHVSNPAVLTAVDAIANAGSDGITFAGLMEATNRPYGGLRADLAGLTKLCKRLFGKNASWPFDVWYEDEATYYMNAEVAQLWRAT